MPLYFRSDTRPLEVIQKTGFIPKEDHGNDWWHVATRANEALAFFERKKATDAVKNACVSLSTKFESAALFPLTWQSDFVYIYACALPSATKLEFTDNNNEELILIDEIDSPAEIKQKIIDLHSLQASQVGNIAKAEKNDKVNKHATKGLYAYSAWPLYAYEAIAHHVAAENIICAIKVYREGEQYTKIHNPWEFSQTNLSKRAFKTNGEILLNKLFLSKQTYLSGDAENSKSISVSYTEEAEQAYEIINDLRDKNLKTPDVYYGLGGKTF